MTGQAPPAASVRDLLAGRAEGTACEVEIGCGNGHFLVAYASGKPDALLFGIDRKGRRCRRAREKAEKRGLVNVHILHGPAESYLVDFPPGSVDAFHIYFPDPWPKSRHRKRRFFTRETLADLSTKLRAGGRLYFGTDFFDYYLQAKVLVALHGGFRLTEEPAPEAVLSSMFGQLFVEANKTIRIFTAVRLASADDEREQDEHEGKVHQHVQPDEGH